MSREIDGITDNTPSRGSSGWGSGSTIYDSPKGTFHSPTLRWVKYNPEDKSPGYDVKQYKIGGRDPTHVLDIEQSVTDSPHFTITSLWAFLEREGIPPVKYNKIDSFNQ